MSDAVIVSTARTGLAKSWRGALNMTHGATMGAHVVRAAVERAKVDPAEVEDVVMGCAMPEGTTGGNVDRVVTPLCIFQRSNGMLDLESIHPGVDPAQVQVQTGWPVQLDERMTRTPAPTEAELCALRVVDPENVRRTEF